MGRIEWEKYKEVFTPALEKDGFVDNDDDDDEEEWTRRQFDTESRPQFSVAKGPFLIGPQGLIPLTEGNLPSRLYNLWIGHTDFLLTQEAVGKIERVPGVEVLRVFSPYRFWLGIGRLFSTEEVKTSIEELFATPPPSTTPVSSTSADVSGESRTTAILVMKKFLARTYPFWAIVQLPNGRLRTVGGQTVEEVENRLDGCSIVDSSWGPMKE